MTQPVNRKELAAMIDHAVLAPQAGGEELRVGCEIARRFAVKCLCVKPCYVAEAAGMLAGSGVRVGTVVSFPHGADDPAVKAEQARRAAANGADELDMVINIGALRDGSLDLVRQDIAGVVEAAAGRCVKVILECALLDESQKRAGCLAAERAGARFVKTSTGFAATGAIVADVRLMRSVVSEAIQVKAAGGIRTLETALALIQAGASRIGTSATAAILEELEKTELEAERDRP